MVRTPVDWSLKGGIEGPWVCRGPVEGGVATLVGWRPISGKGGVEGVFVGGHVPVIGCIEIMQVICQVITSSAEGGIGFVKSQVSSFLLLICGVQNVFLQILGTKIETMIRRFSHFRLLILRWKRVSTNPRLAPGLTPRECSRVELTSSHRLAILAGWRAGCQ